MGAVAGHDGRPRVEQVVGLEMEAAVVGGQHLEGLGRRAVQCAAVVAEQHEGQRTLAEEMARRPRARSARPRAVGRSAPALSSTSISSGRVSDD